MREGGKQTRNRADKETEQKEKVCDETGKAGAACGKEGWHAAPGTVTPTGLVLGQPAKGPGQLSQPQLRQPASGLAHASASSTRVRSSAHDCSLPQTWHTRTSREGKPRPAHEHVDSITDNKQEFLNSIVLGRTENHERDTAQSF